MTLVTPQSAPKLGFSSVRHVLFFLCTYDSLENQINRYYEVKTNVYLPLMYKYKCFTKILAALRILLKKIAPEKLQHKDVQLIVDR